MSESVNNSQLSAELPLPAHDESVLDVEVELLEFCKTKSISVEGLREIIKRHGITVCKNVECYEFFRSACSNERVTEEIIQCLLEYFPDAASATDDISGQMSLHMACMNSNVRLNIIQLIIDAAPDSVRSVDCDGSMPLHCLCDNDNDVGEVSSRETPRSGQAC